MDYEDDYEGQSGSSGDEMEGGDDYEEGGGEGEEGGVQSVEDLQRCAEQCVSEGDTVRACGFLERASNIAPDNVDVLEEFAELLLSCGNTAKAQRLLLRCTQLAPNTGHEKYLSLGQLSQGRDAADFYTKGTQLLTAALATPLEDKRRAALARELSSAHCALAELWMTDLCYEDSAELHCQRAVEAALAADDTNADAHHAKASLLISLQRPDDALQALRVGYAMWRKEEKDDDGDDDKEDDDDNDNDDNDDDDNGQKGMDLGDDEHGDEEPDDDDEDNMPSFSSRLTAAKLFLELGQPDEAQEILSALVLENEEEPELYFLLAMTTDDLAARSEFLQLAMAKVDKAQMEGETDLEHLKKAIAGAIREMNAGAKGGGEGGA